MCIRDRYGSPYRCFTIVRAFMSLLLLVFFLPRWKAFVIDWQLQANTNQTLNVISTFSFTKQVKISLSFITGTLIYTFVPHLSFTFTVLRYTCKFIKYIILVCVVWYNYLHKTILYTFLAQVSFQTYLVQINIQDKCFITCLSKSGLLVTSTNIKSPMFLQCCFC